MLEDSQALPKKPKGAWGRAVSLRHNARRLVQLLQSPDSKERLAAAAVLRDTHDRIAVPALIAALDDDDYRVRISAAVSLGALGSEAAAPALIRQLKRPRERPVAAEALGRLKSRAAVEPLIELLDDRSWEVRHDARRALGEIGDPAAIPALRAKERPFSWLIRDAIAQIERHVATREGKTLRPLARHRVERLTGSVRAFLLAGLLLLAGALLFDADLTWMLVLCAMTAAVGFAWVFLRGKNPISDRFARARPLFPDARLEAPGATALRIFRQLPLNLTVTLLPPLAVGLAIGGYAVPIGLSAGLDLAFGLSGLWRLRWLVKREQAGSGLLLHEPGRGDVEDHRFFVSPGL